MRRVRWFGWFVVRPLRSRVVLWRCAASLRADSPGKATLQQTDHSLYVDRRSLRQQRGGRAVW